MAPTAADREAKLVALHQRLADQVRELHSGEDWTRWLAVASRFHNYSFNNTLLILAQRPEATTVAGYRAWQALGRQVDKGEKGLQILTPVHRKIEATDPETGEPERAARIAGYRVAHVWDVSQTSGHPLPQQPMVQLLTGHAPEGLWDSLEATAEEHGFTVHRDQCGGANGLTHFGNRTITVRPDVDDAQAVKTLAHELGHMLLHEPVQGVPAVACRGVIEVEAESVAYLITASHDLDTGSYTFPYVAGWAASVAGRTPEEIVADVGRRVLRATKHILDRTTHPLDAAAVNHGRLVSDNRPHLVSAPTAPPLQGSDPARHTRTVVSSAARHPPAPFISPSTRTAAHRPISR